MKVLKKFDDIALWRYNVIMIKGGNVMATQTKRATIYFDPELHKALKIKALETSRSITDLVNQAVRESLSEDAEDIFAYEERKDEKVISYDQMLKNLRKDGRI